MRTQVQDRAARDAKLEALQAELGNAVASWSPARTGSAH